MFKLIGLFIYETCRFACLWNKSDYITRLWLGSMQINVVITKVFQAVSVRYLGRSLEVNIDRVPYTTSEINIPIVVGVKVGEVIGSGMVAVVFEGMTLDGPVILKVKRRNIATRIDSGLRDARRILWMLHWLPGLRSLGLDAVHTEVREMLLGQLDFRQEVRNQQEFGALFTAHTNIVIPKIYEELCTDDVIVMERLIGTRIPTRKHETAIAIASTIAASVLKGIVHADLHMGNVIFMEERVGIIDFGLMLRLSPLELDAYRSIFTASAMKDFRDAADKALRFYMLPINAMHDLSVEIQCKLAEEIASLYENALLTHNSFGVSDVLSMATVVRPYGMSIAPIFYKTMMSMAAGDLLMKNLTPEPTELLLQQVALELFR